MRWSACGLVVAVVAGAACGGGAANRPDGGGGLDGGGGPDGGGGRWGGALQLTQAPLDVLFLIDDSSAMKLAQDKLLRSFPTFMTRLQDPPGLPNLHIAVVSQDMGAGDGSIASCSADGGKKGIFQYTARGACTATSLKAGATYIENADGVTNYTGNIADVFSCIAALGEAGCGFEHQFAAIRRALGVDGRGAAPPENEGFLRPDAMLAVIMLTNEDDCSASPSSSSPNGEIPLFDTGVNTNITSQLGPPGNFRCNEFGHMCSKGSGDFMHPDRSAPGNDVSATVTYDACRSNDQEGYLLGVVDTGNRLKSLKANPAQVAVISIQAPPMPYTVTWKAPSTSDSSCGAASCPWPQIAHACTASDGSVGDPGVRTAELVEQFGDNGLVLPICGDDFAPSMDLAATLLKSRAVAPCLPGPVGTNAAGTAVDCKVTEHYSDLNGTPVDKEIPSCADNGSTAPCWKLQGGLPACVHQAIRIMPDPDVPQSGSETFTYDCAKCVPGGGCVD
jgi:hypothetical protein